MHGLDLAVFFESYFHTKKEQNVLKCHYLIPFFSKEKLS